MMQEDNQESFKDKDSNDNVKHSQDDINAEDKGRIWVGIEDKIEKHYQKKYRQRAIFKVACVFFLVGVISFLLYNHSATINLSTDSDNVSIVPGSDKAILTLEDGRQIDLTTADENQLSGLGVDFVHMKDGECVYKISSQTNNDSPVGFNTISTPRGGQYRIILPDDSEVLLNASSSLRFSKNIAHESTRLVELTGEGFFKVKKSKERPFIVNTHAQQIRVLGTEFNVNTYNSDKVSTTLIEGSVRLNNKGVLKPGQQGVSIHPNEQPTIKFVEVGDYVDWVNKQFVFKDEKITDIMERLGRWYNFDVQFHHTANLNTTFNGELSRYTDVNDVLKLLSKTSTLKFDIKGNTIIIK